MWMMKVLKTWLRTVRTIIIAHIVKNVFHQTKNALKTTTTASVIKDL
jgi:hypothetical protein